jgi:hypothetical protein
MGLLNVYLNGYAGRLGCNTTKDKGEIKIDYSTFKDIRQAVAANTLRPFHEETEVKTKRVEKKKGFNYGGYIPKDAIDQQKDSLMAQYFHEKDEKALHKNIKAVTIKAEKEANCPVTRKYMKGIGLDNLSNFKSVLTNIHMRGQDK